MKNIIAAVMLSMIPVTSYADGPSSNYAVITAVHPVYRDNYVTVHETVCRDVEVPIYESRGGDQLTGAIIGGVIGNQFGSGSGREAMTVLGAIIGANSVEPRRDTFVGYRVERRCDRVTNRVNEPIITHYRIQYTYNGREYFQETNHRYTLGQRVTVQPSLR
jgi:uncharacterized protein YcfJ